MSSTAHDQYENLRSRLVASNALFHNAQGKVVALKRVRDLLEKEIQEAQRLHNEAFAESTTLINQMRELQAQ
jgi:hypothetical protein